MNIKEIINLIDNVKPYDKGTDIMWTDKHISKHLLEAHINPDINVASRKSSSIDKIINWITEQLGSKCENILDLGCGPGLYTKRFAEKGYNVTGIDFSKNSIEYAKKDAENNDLKIKYICQNYLDMDFSKHFDLIIMIYCDFGVLSSIEREVLVEKIHRALKPGGYFIFDTLNEKSIEAMTFTKQWEMSDGGFWKDEPYLCLSQSLHFPENNATLDQHIVFDENNNYKLYRFWNHYFNQNNIESIFKKSKFKSIKEYTSLLDDIGEYNNEGVSFYKVQKVT